MAANAVSRQTFRFFAAIRGRLAERHPSSRGAKKDDYGEYSESDDCFALATALAGKWLSFAKTSAGGASG